MTMLTHDGITQPIDAWSQQFGIPVATIESRLKPGWLVSRAITWPMADKFVAKRPEPKPVQPKAPRQCQRQRQRKSMLIEFNGEALSIADWARRLGITESGLRSRLDRGWSIERILTRKLEPTHNRACATSELIEFEGERLWLSEWARRTGIRKNTLFARLKAGWTVERALTEPLQPRRPPTAY